MVMLVYVMLTNVAPNIHQVVDAVIYTLTGELVPNDTNIFFFLIWN